MTCLKEQCIWGKLHFKLEKPIGNTWNAQNSLVTMLWVRETLDCVRVWGKWEWQVKCQETVDNLPAWQEDNPIVSPKRMLSKVVAVVEFSIPHKDILDSVVGIVTWNWLDSQGLISRWGRDFLHPSKSAFRPTQPLLQWVTGLLPRGKASGMWH